MKKIKIKLRFSIRSLSRKNFDIWVSFSNEVHKIIRDNPTLPYYISDRMIVIEPTCYNTYKPRTLIYLI